MSTAEKKQEEEEISWITCFACGAPKVEGETCDVCEEPEKVYKPNTVNLIVDIKANCPRCEVSWLGSEIAEEHRHHYGGATHGSRLIGMEDRDIYDGAHSWMCPDCRAVFPRIMEKHAKWKLKMLDSGADIIWGTDPLPKDTSKLCRPDGGRDGSGMFM